MTTVNNTAETGHRIGATTKGAAAGGLAGYGVGKAVAAILTHLFPSLKDVEWAFELLIEFLLLGAGVLLGGKFTPTDAKPVEINLPAVAGPGVAATTVIPDGDGEHRADPFAALDAEAREV